MKKIKLNITIAIIIMISLLSSCGSMLNIQPINSMIPKSLEDFESVLMGGYSKTDFFMNTEYMTDNVYTNANTSYTLDKSKEPWFVWASSHQLEGTPNDAYWGQLYSSVYYANSVLDELKKITPTVEERDLYERVIGEAYALRAFSYFYLINLYADVYSPENLTKPGVPMPLTAVDVNVNSKDNVREQLGKVWEQIEKDMNLASEFLAGKPAINKYRFDHSTIQMLRGRVYLYMGRYQDAINSLNDIISTKTLFNMNNLQSYLDNEADKYAFGGDYGFIDSDYNKEVLFYIGGKANYNTFYYDTNLVKTSPELLALCDYEDNRDYRKYIFGSFLEMIDVADLATGTTVYRMYANQGKSTYYIGFKLSEAYVTRAECYVRLNQKDKAIADLNTLLVTRFKKDKFEALKEGDFTNEQALTKVLNERRLETAFDGGLRWFDLRRLGKPRITHIYKNGAEYVLEKNDPKYILQIPVSEQEASPNMPLNPR